MHIYMYDSQDLGKFSTISFSVLFPFPLNDIVFPHAPDVWYVQFLMLINIALRYVGATLQFRRRFLKVRSVTMLDSSRP